MMNVQMRTREKRVVMKTPAMSGVAMGMIAGKEKRAMKRKNFFTLLMLQTLLLLKISTPYQPMFRSNLLEHLEGTEFSDL